MGFEACPQGIQKAAALGNKKKNALLKEGVFSNSAFISLASESRDSLIFSSSADAEGIRIGFLKENHLPSDSHFIVMTL